MSRKTLPVAAPRSAPALTLQLVAPELWDRTVAQFDDICREQLEVFAKAHRPGAQYDPVLFWLGGELVGGVLMAIEPLPLRLGRRAMAASGPMQPRSDRPDRTEVYRAMIDALVAEYAVKRGFLFSVQPRAAVCAFNAEYDHLVHRGFSPGREREPTEHYLVDLGLSDDERRVSLVPTWRSELRSSERAGLSFEEAPASRFAEFAALRERMPEGERPDHHSGYDAMPALLALDNERLRPELFFVRHLGEVIAGAIVFKAGDRAVYLHGASSDKALPLRAGYFMQWNIIRWLRDRTTARWYDLGGAGGSSGLRQFKAGLVGEAGAIQPAPPAASYAVRWLPRAANALFGRSIAGD